VCADVVDLGLVPVTYGGKAKQQHKIRIVWLTGELNPENGRPFLVQRRYTLSLDEKASLRRDLESWRGQPFTDRELLGFDVESLIGANAQLNVIHTNKGDAIYANVTGIVPLGRGMARVTIPTDYVRVRDREAENGVASANGDE
jgi:hypothetical protein